MPGKKLKITISNIKINNYPLNPNPKSELTDLLEILRETQKTSQKTELKSKK